MEKKCYQVVFNTVDFAIDIVKFLLFQRSATRAADKAFIVVQIAHCLTGLSLANDIFVALVACSDSLGLLLVLELLFKLRGQEVDFSFSLALATRPGHLHVAQRQPLFEA